LRLTACCVSDHRLHTGDNSDGSNTVGVDDPSGNTGTTGVARELATTAAVAVVASVEAMVTDAASGEPQEDDGDGDKTTIYQHGVCQ